MYKGSQWLSYDDVESVTAKAKYIKDLDLGGAMMWSIDTDDFQGICGGKRFPLLHAIQEVSRTNFIFNV